MIYAFVRLSHPPKQAVKKLAGIDACVISHLTVSSKRQLELAFYLAKRAFGNRTNIARDFRLEFLLWLTAKRDIKNAVLASQPRNGEALLVIFSGVKKKILEKLDAKEIAEKMLGDGGDEVDSIVLENISLSRIG